MRKVQESEHVDCVFGGYTGKKRWEVNHPEHPPHHGRGTGRQFRHGSRCGA